jgi:hypothetical protein
MDAVSGSMLRDDVKRHAREAREREAEDSALAALYEVGRLHALADVLTCWGAAAGQRREGVRKAFEPQIHRLQGCEGRRRTRCW